MHERDNNKYPCLTITSQRQIIDIVNYLYDRYLFPRDGYWSRITRRISRAVGRSTPVKSTFSHFVVVIGNEPEPVLYLTSPLSQLQNDEWFTAKHEPSLHALAGLLDDLFGKYALFPYDFDIGNVSLVLSEARWLRLYSVPAKDIYVPVLFMNCARRSVPRLYSALLKMLEEQISFPKRAAKAIAMESPVPLRPAHTHYSIVTEDRVIYRVNVPERYMN